MIKRPSTKAGRALFRQALSTGGEVWEPDPQDWSANIRAIEAEAAAAERARIRAAVEALDYTSIVTDQSGWDYTDGRDDAITAIWALLDD